MTDMNFDRPKAGMQLCVPQYEFSYFLNTYEVDVKKKKKKGGD